MRHQMDRFSDVLNVLNKYEKWIAWLEKQFKSEQKSVITEDKDVEKAAEEYRNFRMSCGIKDPVMLNEIEEAYYEGAIKQQKPAEWSEEDKDMLYKVTAVVNRLCAKGEKFIWSPKTLVKLFYWLQDLKPQSTWKPSEGQLEALKRVVERLDNVHKSGNEDVELLCALLHDLNALKYED